MLEDVLEHRVRKVEQDARQNGVRNGWFQVTKLDRQMMGPGRSVSVWRNRFFVSSRDQIRGWEPTEAIVTRVDIEEEILGEVVNQKGGYGVKKLPDTVILRPGKALSSQGPVR